jgi:hypothetical protein
MVEDCKIWEDKNIIYQLKEEEKYGRLYLYSKDGQMIANIPASPNVDYMASNYMVDNRYAIDFIKSHGGRRLSVGGGILYHQIIKVDDRWISGTWGHSGFEINKDKGIIMVKYTSELLSALNWESRVEQSGTICKFIILPYGRNDGQKVIALELSTIRTDLIEMTLYEIVNGELKRRIGEIIVRVGGKISWTRADRKIYLVVGDMAKEIARGYELDWEGEYEISDPSKTEWCELGNKKEKSYIIDIGYYRKLDRIK